MKWDVINRRRAQFVGLAILLILFSYVAYVLSWDSRTAILSCSDCGNIRVIQASVQWWRIKTVSVADSHEFAVPPGHVHRWWQYDSRRRNAYRHTAWSRQKYEDGKTEWSGKIDHINSTSGSQQRVEDWLSNLP